MSCRLVWQTKQSWGSCLHLSLCLFPAARLLKKTNCNLKVNEINDNRRRFKKLSISSGLFCFVAVGLATCSHMLCFLSSADFPLLTLEKQDGVQKTTVLGASSNYCVQVLLCVCNIFFQCGRHCACVTCWANMGGSDTVSHGFLHSCLDCESVFGCKSLLFAKWKQQKEEMRQCGPKPLA